jgi:hypothetical protein
MPANTEDIVAWIVANVGSGEVPQDEGNSEALVYNLVQLARNGRPYRKYNYEPDQDAEIEQLYAECMDQTRGDDKALS